MKKKTFASLSQSRYERSMGKPLGLIFLLAVLFVLAATQSRGHEGPGQRSTAQVFGTPGTGTPGPDSLQLRHD